MKIFVIQKSVIENVLNFTASLKLYVTVCVCMDVQSAMYCVQVLKTSIMGAASQESSQNLVSIVRNPCV